MTGPEALAAFNRAAQLVKEGQYEAALSVDMRESDRNVIQARIAAHKAASANRDETTMRNS